MIALAGLETLLVVSWTALGASLVALLWSKWYLTLPVSYLFALSIVVEMESSPGRSPATALGITIYGERTYWTKLLRIGLTPPMLLLGMIGYIRCFRGKLSLPEAITGSDFRELDLQLDPRPQTVIFAGRAAAKKWLTAYTVSTLLVAGTVFVLSMSAIRDEPLFGADPQWAGMSKSDQKLLAAYLELSALHPDALEYHVRLASLYHRNGMESDLRYQLEEIRRLNPEHAMLILADASEIAPGKLISSRADSLSGGPSIPEAPPDSSGSPGDSTGVAEADTLPERFIEGDASAAEGDEGPDTPETVEPPDSVETPDSAETVSGREQEGEPEHAEPAPEPDGL